MTAINPPFAMQNAGTTHTAENDRMMLSGLFAGVRTSGSMVSRGGVHPLAGGVMAVTQTGSPSMAVSVASGVVYVSGSEGGKQGIYACTNDAAVVVTLDAAHGTLPRIDSIIARVQDSAYSGATNTWTIEKVTGTAASSPVAPTLLANTELLANVTVGAAVSSVTNANITDTRKYATAVGGIIPCLSTAAPAANTIPDGQFVYFTNTGELQVKFAGALTMLTRMDNIAVTQVFTASGTWTKPAGAKSVWIRVVGGGGAGGGSQVGSSGLSSKGAGGGGGAYAERMMAASAITSTVAVTRGAGGTGASAAAGNAGATSSFGSYIGAGGGLGGQFTSPNSAGWGVTGGAGGNTFSGTPDLSVAGGGGGMGFSSGPLAAGGTGGSTPLGGGGVGATAGSTIASSAGSVGGNYGGGGGGSITNTTGASTAGGAGAPGVVVVTTYF